MNLLQNPEKQPDYREKRDHSDFLIPLSETMSDKESLPTALIEEMVEGNGFDSIVVDPDDNELIDTLSRKHHKSNSPVNINNIKLDGFPSADQRWF